MTRLILFIFIFHATMLSAQWKQLNGPYSLGRTYQVAVKDSFIITGDFSGNVFRSNNSGQTWLKSSIFGKKPYYPEEFAIHCFLISDSGIFVGTERGVFISKDNGEKWTGLDTGYRTLYLAFEKIGDHLFALTSKGVSRSDDYGKHWLLLKYSNLPSELARTLATHDGNIYLGTRDSGIYFSSNLGKTWTKPTSGLPVSSQIEAIAFLDSIIFAGDYGGGVYCSNDGGDSWATKNTGLPKLKVTSLIVKDSTIIIATDNGYGAGNLFRSSDKGNNWKEIGNGLFNINVYSFVVKGNYLFASTSRGIFTSTDNGDTWIPINSTFTNFDVRSIAILGSTIMTSADAGNFMSHDNGMTWSIMPSDTMARVFTAFSPIGNEVFGASWYLLRSINNGLSWSIVYSNLANPIDAITTQDSCVFAAARNLGILRSCDHGSTWKLLSLNSGSINLLVSEEHKIVAVEGNHTYVSEDNGDNWISFGQPPWGPINDIVIRDKAVLATNSSEEGGILKTLFAGYTPWTTVYPRNDVGPIKSVANKIFVGTNTGVIMSMDDGNNWGTANLGLPNCRVLTITLDDKYIYVGTSENGIWKRPLSEMTGINETEFRDKDQVSIYPNPGRGIFTIQNSTLIESIEIYSITGEKVKAESLSQPKTSAEVDISTLSKGIYFIRLSGDQYSHIQKVILY